MENYDAPPRPLVFPLKNPLVDSAITEDDADCLASSFVWPEDSDERVLVPFYLSLNEYVVLSNTIDVGRDIAYGEDSIKVLWLWLRNMRCDVSLCDAIIACIENNPATLQAIIDGLSSSDEFNTFISEKVEGLTTGQIIEPLIAGSCDNAVLAGKMLAMVNSLSQNNTDALEIIEVGTNDEEKVAALLEGIPLFGELPFGDIIDFTQDLLEDFGENYDAAATTERKEALARDLWCLAKTKDACVLSYGDLFEFFQARALSGLTLDSLLQNMIEWVFGGDFSSDQLVFDSMFAIQIACVRMGKEFFGVNMPRIGSLARDALPSSIWEEWTPCGEPPDECAGGTTVEWQSGQNGFSVQFGRATYYSGSGWGLGGGWTSRCSIQGPFSPTVEKFKFTSFRSSEVVRLLAIPSGTLVGQTTVGVDNGDGTFTYEILDISGPTATMTIDCGSTGLAADYRMLRCCWNYD